MQRLTIHGKRHDIGLGGYSLVSLAEAREAAFLNQPRTPSRSPQRVTHDFRLAIFQPFREHSGILPAPERRNPTMPESAVNSYPIFQIQPEWVIAEEDMGSKPKFWYRSSPDQPEWLFKYPQSNTGQHWAEKIAAEIASAVGIPHAPVELAVFQNDRGSATESFMQNDLELVHGNQILAGQLLDYDPDKRFHQSEHTLSNILDALERVFASPRAVLRAKRRIAEYLVLDALIGNTDRHHENWGILRRVDSQADPETVAPTFDHASSLGRELLDEGVRKTRRRLLDENRIGPYSEAARGAIYWRTSDRRAVSPLELLRNALTDWPDVFHPALTRLDDLHEDRLRLIVARVPDAWMTDLSRTFAIELMSYNLCRIKRIST